MSFRNILKKSLTEGFVQREMGTAELLGVMLLALLFAFYLFAVYRRAARGPFYSGSFAVSMAAMTVITAGMVSSLQANFALSLGMVGALSIVRFRTSVKGTLDQIFLFWAVSAGILCGGRAAGIAAVESAAVTACIFGLSQSRNTRPPKLLQISLKPEGSEAEILALIREYDRDARVKARDICFGCENMIVEIYTEKEQALMDGLRSAADVDAAVLCDRDGNAENVGKV